MRKICIVLVCILICTLLCPMVGCSKEKTLVLNVYNCEEYIAEGDFDMVREFEKYYKEQTGKKVKVNYSTYGTNENMYNELKLTKNKKNNTYSYDLVCPSDYMLQKMLEEDMLEKYDLTDGKYDFIPEYEQNCSEYIKDIFKANGWYEYAVCYMWGTMGYVYNPTYVETTDMKHWKGILNKDYKYKSTIKDSPRDSYILAQGIACEEELLNLAKDETYNQKVIEIFNRNDVDSINKAGNVLRDVKESVYGFEVDSGKGDMASGKLWINFAWSGDAVYTLDVAEDEGDTELYYSVPEEGSNVWFDGWVMPKGANKELAQAFLNFISTPANTIENMNYIGYTPSIAGDEMLDNARSWYGLYVLNPLDDQTSETFDYEQDGIKYEEVYFGDLNSSAGVYDVIYPIYDDEEENIIGLEEVSGVQVYEYDVSYFFGDNSTILTDVNPYFEDEQGLTHTYSGRQLFTQYPDAETVTRCAIMLHFDKTATTNLNNMWSSVKIGYMSPVVMFLIFLAIVLCIVAFFVIRYLLRSGKFGYGKIRKGLTLVSREEIKVVPPLKENQNTKKKTN